MLRATLTLVLLLVLGSPAAPATASPSGAPPRQAAEPVILVHGWHSSAQGMAVMRDRFTAAGHPAFALDLPGEDNVVNARAISRFVDDVLSRTGAARAHLVGHSMGGLSTRHFLKRMGGTDRVRTYVSFGTGQYGYLPACLLAEDQGGQMCPFSAFLADLNAGDDTPGDVAYTTMRSTLDTPDTYRLDGGACFHEIPDVPHAEEPDSPEFFAAALSAVRGVCPGRHVELPIR
ncbi:esterase/lipase family protein [Streptoalloteichus hindustanus]|uniref:Triacylglycerol lipase n=1 Tax=Streptoalloteichus hindustanus TaxID=2017 RepID=A0A1M4XR54_STRHI|nr:alpha/beta fold hydrolase [Streptoalloteichus hindustanus]SHE95925.1 triacylglycerol lipase [Streptoalloteichus hindustanus]